MDRLFIIMVAKNKTFKWTPKRELFCCELVKDFNQTKAAIRAGFSKRTAGATGHELMQLAPIQERVAEMAKKAQDEAGVDAAYVLKGAKELFERCMQHKPVFDKEGNQVLVETAAGDLAPAYMFDSAGAARALRTLGDHIQVSAFKPKDDDGKPIDQNWRITFVDAATGKQTVFDAATGKPGGG